MLRRASLALFVLAIGLAVACGRQITPNPTFKGVPGTIQLRFRTVAPANFSSYNYFVAVNTTGDGQEPYASGFQAGQFKDFSYAVVTGASSGGLNTVLPTLIQYYILVPGGAPQFRPLALNPATTQLALNTATTTSYSEFTVIFSRSQLSLPLPSATTPPPPTPTPKGATPTPTPSSVPTGPTPVASPTIPSQSTWCINLFTTNWPSANVVYDAMGTGATDHSFNRGCFDVNTYEDIVVNQYPEVNPPSDPASQLAGFEIINSP
jgi:hypothetical protein